MGNQIRTVLLLTAMTALVLVIGQLLGGRQGMVLAFILAIGMNFFSYWYSDKIVLKMYRASEITPNQAPELYNMVKTLAQRAGLPMPRVCLIPEEAPNAFATGRNPENAVVAVTQGLLNRMNSKEIMGVLAHEMAHVYNRDILIGAIAATMAGAIMLLANFARFSAFFGGHRSDEEDGLGGIGLLVMSIIAPIAAVVIQMAVSRRREYLADATGARFAGETEGLAGALEKLGAYSGQIPMRTDSPATAHMFIVNPLSGKSLKSLFSTHPPLEDRISRLRGRKPPRPPAQGGQDQRMEQGKAFWDNLS
ncbi:MAG: zinc metalloprotease HtpX [Desulfobacteraceae bacterium]|nr:zinc metalloprotease HtpX [Desulfobacteraceae bacterium]